MLKCALFKECVECIENEDCGELRKCQTTYNYNYCVEKTCDDWQLDQIKCLSKPQCKDIYFSFNKVCFSKDSVYKLNLVMKNVQIWMQKDASKNLDVFIYNIQFLRLT